MGFLINKNLLASMTDHTLLRADATEDDVLRLCDEAAECRFHAVCISPCYVSRAAKALNNTAVRVCTVAGFPLGSTYTEAKALEAKIAAAEGAHEIDMVINVGAVKSSRWEYVLKDISEVVKAAPQLTHKVIIEACYLTDEEKVKSSHIIMEAGAVFVKTSTGFGPGGATVHDIRIIREAIAENAAPKGRIGIKAAGGIKTLSQAIEVINAGATRIGTSSGVSIMAEAAKASMGP